eukprot:GHVU01130184.1.p1 GENE.GHVU01130184.1~~GHVU01130184.1.p1  ORF type:complete len:277 (+),score=4.75 GHVU01130184.1:196-1026(+)
MRWRSRMRYRPATLAWFFVTFPVATASYRQILDRSSSVVRRRNRPTHSFVRTRSLSRVCVSTHTCCYCQSLTIATLDVVSVDNANDVRSQRTLLRRSSHCAVMMMHDGTTTKFVVSLFLFFISSILTLLYLYWHHCITFMIFLDDTPIYDENDPACVCVWAVQQRERAIVHACYVCAHVLYLMEGNSARAVADEDVDAADPERRGGDGERPRRHQLQPGGSIRLDGEGGQQRALIVGQVRRPLTLALTRQPTPSLSRLPTPTLTMSFACCVYADCI